MNKIVKEFTRTHPDIDVKIQFTPNKEYNTLPGLAKPGLLALGVLTVLWSWNDLMWPLIVNTDPERMPLSAGLSALQGEHMTDYPVLMAGSLMAGAPIVVLFVIMQKQLIQGIAFTGSK